MSTWLRSVDVERPHRHRPFPLTSQELVEYQERGRVPFSAVEAAVNGWSYLVPTPDIGIDPLYGRSSREELQRAWADGALGRERVE